MLTSEADTQAAPLATPPTRNYVVVLFPAYLEDRIEAVLDDVGVPGYSRAPDVIGRGPRGRHFDNQVWPGTTGEIFTVVDDSCAAELVDRFAAFNASLQRESRGLYGLHILSWPCNALL